MARRLVEARNLREPKGRKGLSFFAEQLAAGEISIDRFFVLTGPDYARFAHRLHDAWSRSLPSLKVEEVETYLRGQTLMHLPKWDPRRAPIGRYLVFNFHADAQKWLKGKQREERLIADVLHRPDEEREAGEDDFDFAPATQEDVVFCREVIQQTPPEDRESVLALLFEGSELAAQESIAFEGVDERELELAEPQQRKAARKAAMAQAKSAMERAKRGLARLLA